MYLKQGLVALLALGPVSAAWAVPATDEGAERLKGVFQTYMGGIEGVVSVTPKGETYDLVIDPAPLIAQIPADEDMKVEFGKLTYQLTDNGDGSWGVTENQIMSWSINMPDQFEQIGSAKIESSGIWDESLPGFREQTAVITGYTSNTTQYIPSFQPDDGMDGDMDGGAADDAASDATGDAAGETAGADELGVEMLSRDTSSTDRIELSVTGKAGVSGGVDHEIVSRAEGFHQTMEYGNLGPMGPMTLEISSPGYDSTAQITGMRNDALLGLAAWLVAHPSEELIAGSQDGLRDKLSAAMPLWDDVTINMDGRDFKVVSPLGDFGVGEFSAEVYLSGVEAEGSLYEKVRLAGLTVPEAIIPPWALPLIPTELTFDFSMSKFNLAAPAKMIIEGFDLTAFEPMEKIDPEALQDAFFDGGAMSMALAPSLIKGQGYQIDYEGEMTFDGIEEPAAQAKVSVTGLDKIEAALNAAPPEEAQQPLMMLQMAKMLSKPGASGEAVWEIDATGPYGTVLVNGQQVAGPPPAQQQ